MIQHFTAGDGARLAYRDEGQGVVVLALAGLTRDGRDFDYLSGQIEGVRLIRLDSRGRGGSQWTGAESYTVVQEAVDALALLDHLGLPSAAILGSSRGGLIGMVIAATARQRLTGLCFNDVGPVLERAGLARIGGYIGVAPRAWTFAEVAIQLSLSMAGFEHVPPARWLQEAERHFIETDAGIGLTYDPALRDAFLAAFDGPAVDLWPLFDACAGLPLAVIRGANSDLLSRKTVEAMRQRRPDMLYAEIPGRGHIPFLDEAEALACIRAWIGRLPAH